MTLDDGSGADLWSEVLTVTDAEAVASHAGRHARGHPERHAPGTSPRGWTRPPPRRSPERVADAAGVRLAEGARPGVEIVRRGRYLFVLNRSDAPAEVPAVGTDLLTGATHNGKVTVGSGSVAVVREGA